jgi:hypothetical protein
VSASGVDTLRNVIVRFDELVDSETAGDEYGYTIPGLDVLTADLLADGRTVKLGTTPQTEGTVYTVTVTGVKDIAGTPNEIGGDNTANFTAFVLSCGFLYFDAYGTIGGNAVSDLVNHSSYPNYPRDSAYITSFNSRVAYPDDSHEQYGARIHGVFIPPVSGNWIFHISADDGMELWLNPGGNDPGGKVKIAEMAGCCANRQLRGQFHGSAGTGRRHALLHRRPLQRRRRRRLYAGRSEIGFAARYRSAPDRRHQPRSLC